ncbi:hypothetical protein V2G26_017218 [Clonostachys chloroleuca]
MDNQAGEQKPKQRRVADRERKRAVRACDGCRRQKEKCDGGVPCRRCIRLRRQCEFHGPTIRQAIPGLEPGIRPQVQPHDNADAAQRLAYMEKLLAHYVGDNVPMDTDNLRGMVEAIEKDQKMDIVDQQPASPGTDYLENEDGNVDEVFTVKALGNNITHYSGEFSHWNFSMRIKEWIEQCIPEHRNENGEVPNFKEYYRAEELQSPSGMISAIGALPLVMSPTSWCRHSSSTPRPIISTSKKAGFWRSWKLRTSTPPPSRDGTLAQYALSSSSLPSAHNTPTSTL